jgi:hypothetical protein
MKDGAVERWPSSSHHPITSTFARMMRMGEVSLFKKRNKHKDLPAGCDLTVGPWSVPYEDFAPDLINMLGFL